MALIPVSWSQAPQGLQKVASVPDALQVLLIGGDLQGEKMTAVSCAFPDLSLVGECQAHTASIQPVF